MASRKILVAHDCVSELEAGLLLHNDLGDDVCLQLPLRRLARGLLGAGEGLEASVEVSDALFELPRARSFFSTEVVCRRLFTSLTCFSRASAWAMLFCISASS